MAVRWQRLIWLWTVSLSLGWMSWMPGWLALLPLSAVLLHLGVFAIEMVLVARLHGHDPAPRPTARALSAAALREAWLAARVFGWRQPWRSAAWPDQPDASGVQGVLLVHGYLCNRAVWRNWYGCLRAAGVPHIGVSLSPAWADIDSYAPQIEQALARLVQGTGRTPLLVGHSMGGLVIRAWWRWRQQRIALGQGRDLVEIEMPRVLTLGTPHLGTWLSRWGGPVNVRQMAPGNPWLEALLASEPAHWRARFTCVHSACDNVVFPPACAVLPGATAVFWPGLAHVELAHDQGGYKLVAKLLDAAAADATGMQKA